MNVDVLSRLTDKQRECMDLVLERRSSKEIARLIGVSKPAVDQRLTAARVALGAASRDEAARIYAALVVAEPSRTSDRVTCDPVQVSQGAADAPMPLPADAPADALVLREAATSFADFMNTGESPARLPGKPSHDLGLVPRLAVIVGLALALLALPLVGLAVAQSLSALLGR